MRKFTPRRMSLVVAASLGILLSGGALAAKFEKIEPSTATATLENGKATVKFTITGSADANENCGFSVNYGDGDSPDTRVLSKADGLLPRTMEHTFNRPGMFTVRVKGERVKMALGCGGEASTSVTILAPAGAAKGAAVKGATAVAAAPVAPSCPDGWALQEKSVDKKTGAFTCGPKMPEKKLECGAGLAYFQTASTVGCRKGK